MGKRQGESVYNINNIVIHMLAAKMEKLQYKVIMTPRYGAQLSPEEFSTAVTCVSIILSGRKTKQIRKLSFIISQLANERPFTNSQGDGG